MRRIGIAVLTVAALCGAAWGLDIVKDGKPVAAVVTPDKPDVVAAEAAKLIVELVKAGTGAALPVAVESKAPADGPRIFVGWTEAARKRETGTLPGPDMAGSLC